MPPPLCTTIHIHHGREAPTWSGGADFAWTFPCEKKKNTIKMTYWAVTSKRMPTLILPVTIRKVTLSFLLILEEYMFLLYKTNIVASFPQLMEKSRNWLLAPTENCSHCHHTGVDHPLPLNWDWFKTMPGLLGNFEGYFKPQLSPTLQFLI